MKTLVLLAVLLAGCGAGVPKPSTCQSAAGKTCYLNTDGRYYQFTMTAYGLFPDSCACVGGAP